MSVIVDDRDSDIRLVSGTWSQPVGGPGQEFRRGVSALNPGGQWRFTYRGRDIEIYASLQADSVTGKGGNATFTIDGGLPTFYQGPGDTSLRPYQNLIYQSSGLKDGEHTLLFTQNTIDSRRTTYFDYLIYQIGESTVPTSKTRVFVDDRELTSGTSWSQDTMQMAFRDTVSRGSTGATLTYNFFGSEIYVNGVLEPTSSSSRVTFQVDGGPLKVFDAPQRGSNAFDQELFKQVGLDPAAPHSITISAQSEGIAIDYLLVVPVAATLSPPLPPVSSASPSQTSLAVPSSTSSSSSRVNLGAIVGGAIGGGLVLGLSFVLVWWIWIRRRRERGENFTPTPYTDDGNEVGTRGPKGEIPAPRGSSVRIFPLRRAVDGVRVWDSQAAAEYGDAPPSYYRS